jgi:uncharacterized membrane protein/predicted metal-dependent phosphoesterase TrpH
VKKLRAGGIRRSSTALAICLMFLLVFLVHIIALALAGPLTGEFKGTSAAPDNTLSDTGDSKIHMTVSRSGGVAISNPYKNYPYWFKGNLHSHTTNSDGSNTPAQMMAAYRANGYSFNAIADHRYLTDSEQFTDLPSFLGENGEEVGSGTHMLAINIENWISSSGSVADWVRETLRQGGMAIPAHPAYFGYTLDTLRAAVDAGAMGMEIHGDASSGPEAREWWDNLLSENRHVYGFMNDDAHSIGGIGSWGWNMVNAESLNEENILQNLMEGNFYCVQTSPPGGIGPEIYSITVENENTIVIRSPGTYVTFIGNYGTVLATEGFVDGAASYSPSTEYTYVRMEVHDADGVSYTQPLLISVPELEIFISPGENSAENGQIVTFTVSVSNNSENGDNYTLENRDILGWGLELENDVLKVPAGENRETTLTVQIPPDAIGCTRDNITIIATSQSDNTVKDNTSCIAHATILRRVQVVITPPSQENENGGALRYDVLVMNLGNVQENFQLARGDNAGWTPSLDNTWLLVPKGENRTTKLTVNIPTNATGGTWDNIWVKATSQENAEVFDNKSCLAHVTISRGVDVSISPTSNSGLPGSTLTYTVTVINTGTVSDTYTLENSDNSGWSLSLDNTLLTIPRNENRTTTLRVTIPDNAENCTRDNITVTATSADNTVKDNASCTAHCVSENRGVAVSISPSYRSILVGENFAFTVTVKNTGTVSDSYNLTKGDNAIWTLNIQSTVGPISPGASENVTLTVTVPDNAVECTHDNVWVRATSQTDNTVWAENSCIAHATENIVPGVEVSISPSENSAENGRNVTFTVTIRNTGNALDNYTLENSDNSGWSLALSPSTLSLGVGASGTATLTVAIPTTAENCTRDNITVTATSSENATIENSATCVAHCLVGAAPTGGVQVTISENSKSGKPGDELSFAVVVTNTSTGTDTFSVTAEDTENWARTVSPTSFSLNAGGSRNVGLTVTIPSTAADGASTTITVTATGTGHDNSAICTATAQAGGGISPFVYVGAVVVIVVIIAALLIFIKPF